ncbi:MAG TPA: response regulator [Pyrinomonadaceae bacterium]|nr:response regulator [Pyrinomonadaceae bacterium]
MQDSLSPENAASARVGVSADVRTRHSPKVLVAEDNADIRLMMKTLLGMKGYRVVEASDGHETMEVARAEQPDIILMDLQLPRLNGFAVTRSMRQDEMLRDTPIVIVTGHDPARHLSLALAAGCNAYVLKPIDFDSLSELIVSLLPHD